MGKIIANMVVRNEESNYLPQVLERLKGQVDEIVVTDDASTDGTVDLVRQYTDHVQVLDKPLFSTHEGELRQKSWDFLEEVTKPTTEDWVLAIDADEELYETTHSLREIIEVPQLYVANVVFFHMWNEKQFRLDKAWKPHGSTRFFRYQPSGRFKDKALAPGSEPIYVGAMVRQFRSAFLRFSGLEMKHLSYIKDEDKKAKYDRYMEIDGGAFHSNAHILSIMDEDPVLEDWKWT